MAGSPKQLCRVKRAVKEIIRQHPEGMTCEEICVAIQTQSLFLGTYRNLLSQSAAVLGLLIMEGSIKAIGEGPAKIYLYEE